MGIPMRKKSKKELPELKDEEATESGVLHTMVGTIEEKEAEKTEEIEEKAIDKGFNKDHALLGYEQLLLSLNDIESQIITQRRNIRDESRVDGLISEQDLISNLLQKQNAVIGTRQFLLDNNLDERDLQDIEDRVTKGAKAYELFTTTKKK